MSTTAVLAEFTPRYVELWAEADAKVKETVEPPLNMLAYYAAAADRDAFARALLNQYHLRERVAS